MGGVRTPQQLRIKIEIGGLPGYHELPQGRSKHEKSSLPLNRRGLEYPEEYCKKKNLEESQIPHAYARSLRRKQGQTATPKPSAP